MEKQPSFEKIIGGTNKQKEEVLETMEMASTKTGAELFGQYLVEPTMKEEMVVEEAVTYANAVAKQYGASRQFGTDRVFLLESGAVEDLSDGRIQQGVCNFFDKSIGAERNKSGALLAVTIVHEMFHINSYQSAQIYKNGGNGLYRSGISMTGRNKEGDYFGVAEEAIIAILSKKFFDEVILKSALYQEELDRTSKTKDWLLIFAEQHVPEEKRKKFKAAVQDILILPMSEEVYQKLHDSNKDDIYKYGYFNGFFKAELKSGTIFRERSMERETFEEVLDRIVLTSKDNTISKEYLFDEFARAHFTGNYIPLSRVIENVLGKGSFRRIAIELGNMKPINSIQKDMLQSDIE